MIVVTLVSVYCGLWKATTTLGVKDVFRRHYLDQTVNKRLTADGRWLDIMQWHLNVSADVPLVVGINGFKSSPKRHYYFWFFGSVAKLPFEREI